VCVCMCVCVCLSLCLFDDAAVNGCRAVKAIEGLMRTWKVCLPAIVCPCL
jgi:hypothetical protein